MSPRDAYEQPPGREPAAVTRRSLLGLRMTARAEADVDHVGVTARTRAAWERDGHEPLLRALEPVAEVLADLVAVGADHRVLDAGAADGNVALACARRGAEVAACDLAAGMVRRGAARCPDIEWARADVAELPYDDGTFDVVVSAFGVPLASRPRRVVRELARVLRPGGRLVLAAWIARGLPGGLYGLVPPPQGVPSPATWGDEAIARRRLGAGFVDIESRMRTVRLAFDSPDAAFAALVRGLPIERTEWPALRPRFDRLLASTNNRPPAVEVDARYRIHLATR